MMRKIRPVLISLVVVLAMALLATYLLPLATQGALGHAAVRITYAYQGAEQGLAPGGGTLDVQDLRSDEMLEMILQQGDYGDLDNETLRQHLQILPVLNTDPTRAIIYGTPPGPGNTSEASPAQVRPMSYDIMLRAGLPGDEQALLGAVVQEYLIRLRAQYAFSAHTVYIQDAPQPGAELDYRETVQALLSQAAVLEARAGRYVDDTSSLSGAGSAQGFEMLQTEAATMASVTLRRLLDEIDTYALSRDPQARLAYDEALLLQQRAELAGLQNGGAFVLAELGVQPAESTTQKTDSEPSDSRDGTEAGDADSAADLEVTADEANIGAGEPVEENPEEPLDIGETTAQPSPAATSGSRATHLLERYLEETQAITRLKDSLARTENRLAVLREGAPAGRIYTNMTEQVETSIAEATAELSGMNDHLTVMAQEYFDVAYGEDILVSAAGFVRYRFGHPVANFFVLAALWLLACWGVRTLLRNQKALAWLGRVSARIKRLAPARKKADDG